MPSLSNKFTPKSIPMRRQDIAEIRNKFGSDCASKELSVDLCTSNLKLNDFETAFKDAQLTPASRRLIVAYRENVRLRKKLLELVEKKDMLQQKYGVLFDMRTDKTVETEQQAEVQRAQNLGSLKSKSKKHKG